MRDVRLKIYKETEITGRSEIGTVGRVGLNVGRVGLNIGRLGLNASRSAITTKKSDWL